MPQIRNLFAYRKNTTWRNRDCFLFSRLDICDSLRYRISLDQSQILFMWRRINKNRNKKTTKTVPATAVMAKIVRKKAHPSMGFYYSFVWFVNARAQIATKHCVKWPFILLYMCTVPVISVVTSLCIYLTYICFPLEFKIKRQKDATNYSSLSHLLSLTLSIYTLYI